MSISSKDLPEGLTPASVPSQGGNGGNGEAEAAKRAQEIQQQRDQIARVLDTAARERLSRIALVSPERSQQIESILIRLLQGGQLRGRVSEEQLIQLLEQMEESQGKTTAKKSTILFQRRPDPDDDWDF